MFFVQRHIFGLQFLVLTKSNSNMKNVLFFFSLMAMMFLVVPQACADPPDTGQPIVSFSADQVPAASFQQAQLPEVVLLEYDSPGLIVPIMATDTVLNLCIVYLDAVPRPPDRCLAGLVNTNYFNPTYISNSRLTPQHFDPG
jgi:hypothetical protein